MLHRLVSGTWQCQAGVSFPVSGIRVRGRRHECWGSSCWECQSRTFQNVKCHWWVSQPQSLFKTTRLMYVGSNVLFDGIVLSQVILRSLWQRRRRRSIQWKTIMGINLMLKLQAKFGVLKNRMAQIHLGMTLIRFTWENPINRHCWESAVREEWCWCFFVGGWGY